MGRGLQTEGFASERCAPGQVGGSVSRTRQTLGGQALRSAGPRGQGIKGRKLKTGSTHLTPVRYEDKSRIMAHTGEAATTLLLQSHRSSLGGHHAVSGTEGTLLSPFTSSPLLPGTHQPPQGPQPLPGGFPETARAPAHRRSGESCHAPGAAGAEGRGRRGVSRGRWRCDLWSLEGPAERLS